MGLEDWEGQFEKVTCVTNTWSKRGPGIQPDDTETYGH